jgi:FlhB HrpN YscU SpaS Family
VGDGTVADKSDLERTEPASQRRLEQAREEGQVPQSRELSAFLERNQSNSQVGGRARSPALAAQAAAGNMTSE